MWHDSPKTGIVNRDSPGIVSSLFPRSPVPSLVFGDSVLDWRLFEERQGVCLPGERGGLSVEPAGDGEARLVPRQHLGHLQRV